MKKSFTSFSICILHLTLFLFIFSSCKKSSETFNTPSINDYFPLQTGKYITYKLDSLIYYNFGTRDSISSSQVKYIVDSLLSDNTGRPAYRIYKYYRKRSSDTWAPQSTIWGINDGNKMEWIEDNLTYIKMILPIQNDKSWKGNSYLSNFITNNPTYNYLDNWDYSYSNVGGQEVIGTYTLANTLTINQRNVRDGIPDNPDAYSEIVFSQEKYAQGIGMVYKKFLRKEYQPNGNASGGSVAEGSYGVEYTMIDHN